MNRSIERALGRKTSTGYVTDLEGSVNGLSDYCLLSIALGKQNGSLFFLTMGHHHVISHVHVEISLDSDPQLLIEGEHSLSGAFHINDCPALRVRLVERFI